MTHAATPSVPERRTFFHWLTYLAGAAATVILSIPLVGFILGGFRRRPQLWITLGPVKRFPQGQTQQVTFDNPLRQPWDGMTARGAVFVCYLGKDSEQKEQFRVLAVNCAHLGCPVAWFPRSALFMCPCHGGVYYETGERASGPPPRGLYACVWQVSTKGELEIQAPHYPSLQDTLQQPADV